MFDTEGYYYYLRQKISLENKLTDYCDLQINKEVKSQILFVEERLLARIKQAHQHAMQEMATLRMILVEASKA